MAGAQGGKCPSVVPKVEAGEVFEALADGVVEGLECGGVVGAGDGASGVDEFVESRAVA